MIMKLMTKKSKSLPRRRPKSMRTKTPDPSTVRSTVIRLRVTQAEVELFKRKAREAGCKSVSEYIRLRCIDGI